VTVSGHEPVLTARRSSRARKLAVLFWCMLTRSEDYAHQQPSPTRKKLRRLEITAGAPKYTRRAAGIWSTNDLMRTAELELARQAETSYKRMSTTSKPEHRREKWARVRHRSAHRSSHSNEDTSRAADQAPDVCSSLRRSPAPAANLAPNRPAGKTKEDNPPANTANTNLTFIGRSLRHSEDHVDARTLVRPASP
jgi:hypothetical protein